MKTALIWIIGICIFVAAVKYVGLSHASGCTALEQESKAALLETTRCSVDADCTYIKLSCPFPCDQPVNRLQVNNALSLSGVYQRSCMMVCPECPKYDNAWAGGKVVSCIAGRCEVRP